MKTKLCLLFSVLCLLSSALATDSTYTDPAQKSARTGGAAVFKALVNSDNSLTPYVAATVSGGGDASAANQTAVQANAGSDATKATAVQGITGGKPLAVKIDQTNDGTTNAVRIATSAAVGDGQGSVSALFYTPGGSNSSALLANLNYGYNGATWDRLRVASVGKDLSAVTIDSIATVWTPASGKKFRLMGGTISVSAAMNVLFEDNAAAAFVFRTPKLAADTPYSFVVLGGQGKLSATANNVLKATGSAAGNITGTIYGTEE